MIQHVFARLRQGRRTLPFPKIMPALPDRYPGRPEVDPAACDGCQACLPACPSGALSLEGGLCLDLGRCLLCGGCAAACPRGAITFTGDFRQAASRREDLLLRGQPFALAKPLEQKRLRLFERSLTLRQVSAGGCAACELDTNVLGTLVYDLGRFGIRFAASPRHADGVLVTGPVTENMRLGLEKTWAAAPEPRVAIAVGACAISGGLYAGQTEAHDGCTGFVPVDLFVPGCAPHPWTILDGLLRLLGRAEQG
ncbi:MAG: hydrogenase [Desulfovibrionaceae bacterium CG1_02_65_16]|nr:MAG: hydrogenase [Desulfovibrionaceae bacterium CG1_02_65_16]